MNLCLLNLLKTVLLAILFAVTANAKAQLLPGDPFGGKAAPDAELDDMLDEITGSGFRGLRGAARTEAIRKMFAAPRKEHVPDLSAVITQGLDKPETVDQALRLALSLGGSALFPAGRELLDNPVPARQAVGIQLIGASGLAEKALPVLLNIFRNQAQADNPLLRFELIHACARLRLRQAESILNKWAQDPEQPDNACWARLALVLNTRNELFPEVLADHETIQKQRQELVHDLRVRKAHLTPRVLQNMQRQIEQQRQYIEQFNVLLQTLDKTLMQRIIEFLQHNPEASLFDQLYLALDETLKPENARIFAGLLTVNCPPLQEELAWRLFETGDQSVRTLVTDILTGFQDSEDWQQRALAVRLLELLPAAAHAQTLRRALADSSAYVVEEALRTLMRLRPENRRQLLEPLLDSDRWNRNQRLQWFIRRAAEY